MDVQIMNFVAFIKTSVRIQQYRLLTLINSDWPYSELINTNHDPCSDVKISYESPFFYNVR